MKKILALIFLLSALLLASDGPKLYHDYKSGFAAAQKEGKMMMIMIHLTGCPECAYMENVVFKDDKISAYMDANFINIALLSRKRCLKIVLKLHFYPIKLRFCINQSSFGNHVL